MPKFKAKGDKGNIGRLEMSGKITKKQAASYHKKHSQKTYGKNVQETGGTM
jgi:hypothetical protein